MNKKIEKIIHFLKDRWGVHSILQVFLILLAFAITGMLSVYVSRYIFELLGLTTEHPFLLRAVVYIFTVLPAYQVLLLIVGSLLGQYKFFKKFLSKLFSRLLFWQKTKKDVKEVN
ncbi:prolipoprotein diacylglyceryl transferase [bacterium]|nr:MAG: prolipoprotein diacylglyceryl transferase [bacterium]